MLPSGQHTPQPAAENEAAPHSAQLLGAELPLEATKRPAGQGVHAEAPEPLPM
jgi:hypothetical protein